VDVQPVDGRGVDLHQHFVLFGDRLLDVLDPQHVWRPIVVVDDCFHLS